MTKSCIRPSAEIGGATSRNSRFDSGSRQPTKCHITKVQDTGVGLRKVDEVSSIGYLQVLHCRAQQQTRKAVPEELETFATLRSELRWSEMAICRSARSRMELDWYRCRCLKCAATWS